MRVFLTGATGFIGSRIVPELIDAGHQVLGLTRSDQGAKWLEAAGAQVHRGTLEQPETLRDGAAQADAVIHCAFDHDFANFVANCEKDKRVIAAMAEALRGSDRALVITSGTGMGAPGHGQIAVETVTNFDHPNPRVASELAGKAALDAGVNVSVVRLPQVHDPVKQGLITPFVDISRAQGKVAYVGDGQNRWPAGHVLDAARLYRLAVEKAKPGSHYHAVGEEGITAKAIAEVVGAGLKLPVVSLTPEQAKEHFGWMAMFMSLDMPASSKLTQEWLGWTPKGPDLLTDLRAMDYSAAA